MRALRWAALVGVAMTSLAQAQGVTQGVKPFGGKELPMHSRLIAPPKGGTCGLSVHPCIPTPPPKLCLAGAQRCSSASGSMVPL